MRSRGEFKTPGGKLIAVDLDCTPAAQRLMWAQADLVLFIEKRERLMAPAAHE